MKKSRFFQIVTLVSFFVFVSLLLGMTHSAQAGQSCSGAIGQLVFHCDGANDEYCAYSVFDGVLRPCTGVISYSGEIIPVE